MKSNHFIRLLVCTGTMFTVSPRLMAQDFTGHTYEAVSGNFTWHQAKTNAEARGGYLATITSQAEFDYIQSLGVLPSLSYWLGATDEAQEGTWAWVNGEPWSFSLWNAGEPNNLGGEDYLASASSIGHKWNDFGNPASSQSFYLLEIDRCTPHKATATAQLTNGFVVGAIITDAGCGYTNAPVVLIQGGGGSGATATASISEGRVTAINITGAGCCYTNAPKIVIASPPFVPTVGIRMSKVKVLQNVVLGRRYVLDSSIDFAVWTPTGSPFTAESETVENEFDVDLTGRFFRIREVP